MTLIGIRIATYNQRIRMGSALPTPTYYWPFLGNTDETITGNDGINNGAVLTSDKGGNLNSAYSFVAAENDWMDLTSNISIGTVHSFTYRIKPVADFTFILLNQAALTSYNFFNSNTSFIYLVGAGNDVTFTISPQLNINTYYDVAVVRNGTSVSLYIDGVQKDITQTLTSNNSYTIEELTRNGSFSYDGVIDNFRIYDRVLTTQEIVDIANAP